MHIGGMGEPARLAEGVKAVWDAIRAVRRVHSTPATSFGATAVTPRSLDAAPIERVVGHAPETKDGIVIFKVKKMPEPLVIVAAGVVGLIVHQALGVTTGAAR